MLSTLLSSDLTRRYDVTHVATHRDGSAATKLRAALRGYALVLRQLIVERPDAAWIHLSANASFRRKSVVMALTGVFRVPRVVHVHADDFASYYEQAGSLERAVIRRLLAGSHTLIALGTKWKAVLEDISGREAAVVPNPVAIPPEGGTREPGMIVFLGRYGERKGTPTLVRALAKMIESGTEARLVAAGDGDRDGTIALSRELGITDHVEANGWLKHDEGRELLARAGVFVLPSRAEGLPVALLEAMAAGAPVVATPVGGIPDVIDDGVHGRLIPPDDVDALAGALTEVLADPEGAQRMGDAARAHIAATCSVPVVVDELDAILRAAVTRT